MGIKYRNALKELSNAGFQFREGKGSHLMAYHPEFPDLLFTLANHGRNSDLPMYAEAAVKKLIAEATKRKEGK